MDRIREHYILNYDKSVKRMYGRTRDINNAEDIVQEAYSRALKYYDGQPHLDAWMNTLLNNAMKDHWKSERMQGCSVDEDDEDWEHVGMNEWAEDMWRAIRKEIAKKDSPVRDILFLYYERDYKPREINQVVEESSGNIRIIIHRFRLEMEQKYGELFID